MKPHKQHKKIVNSRPYLEEEIARQRESGSVDYSLQKKLETKIQEDFTDKTGIPLIPNPLELAGLDGGLQKHQEIYLQVLQLCLMTLQVILTLSMKKLAKK